MRQSITTKYIGPSNVRGSRCKATSAGGHTLTVEWDDALNVDENHRAVALALAERLNWSGNWIGGGTKDGAVFVCADDISFVVARQKVAA